MYVRFQKIFISFKCELLFPLPSFKFEGWSVQLGKECQTYNSNLFLAIAEKAGTLGERNCELQWISSILPIPECPELIWWPCQVTLRCLPWSAAVNTWHFPFGGYILPITLLRCNFYVSTIQYFVILLCMVTGNFKEKYNFCLSMVMLELSVSLCMAGSCLLRDQQWHFELGFGFVKLFTILPLLVL